MPLSLDMQCKIKDAVDGTPLKSGETRGLKGEKNTFISLSDSHQGVPARASMEVAAQLYYVHELSPGLVVPAG